MRARGLAAGLLGLTLLAQGRRTAADEPIITIVTELPSGPGQEAALDTLDGIRLAIEDRDGIVGGKPVVLVSREQPGFTESSDEEFEANVTAQADAALGDPSVLGVIGTFNSFAARLFIPALKGELVMVSPTNSATELTLPGFDLRPDHERAYARVCPHDLIQMVNAAEWIQKLQPQRIMTVALDENYPGFVAALVVDALAALGLSPVASASLEWTPGPRPSDHAVEHGAFDVFPHGGHGPPPALTSSFLPLVQQAQPDLIFISGWVEIAASAVKKLRSAGYRGMLLGTDLLWETSFLEQTQGAAEGMLLSSANLATGNVPGEAAAAWRERFNVRFGHPDDYFVTQGIYALYGYVAAQLLLDAIDRAVEEGGDVPLRERVREQVMATQHVESLIGKFSIDANGDTTNTLTSGFVIRGSTFVPELLLGHAEE